MNRAQLSEIVAFLPSDAREIIIKDRKAATLYFGTDQDQPGLQPIICNREFYTTRFRFVIHSEAE